MNTNDMISKIKEVLNLSQEVKLEQQALENGTVLEAEAFESGNEVFIVTEDEKVAVPVGEYTMEDGKILVVAEEGIIAEIKEAEEEEVEAEKEELGYVTKEELAEAVSEIKAMIEDMKKEEMSEEVEEATENEVELSAELQEELAQPAAEPIAHNPEKNNNFNVKFAQNRKQSTLDRVLSKINN